MKIIRTIINDRLLPPDGITVECGNRKEHFKPDDKLKVGEWIKAVWMSGEIQPAYVYYDIDWDSDHVLYAKYELASESIFEIMLGDIKGGKEQ